MSTVYTSPERRAFRFNDHVVMEMMLGVPDEARTGRLVQVRKGSGPFGTDQYFLRLRDNTLMVFANVLMRHVGDTDFEDAFYRRNGKEPPVVPPQPVWEGDSESAEYSITERWPETGFLIEKPKQPESPQQSFAMRVIQP